jgi:hypothetical protein
MMFVTACEIEFDMFPTNYTYFVPPRVSPPIAIVAFYLQIE